MKLLKRTALFLLFIFVLYICSVLGYGMLTDWEPKEIMQAEIHKTSAPNKLLVPQDDLHFAIWNTGYGSNGAESDFSFDDEGLLYSGSSMVYSPRHLTEKNIKGGLDYAKKSDADFFLFQEMDFASDRSYNIPQFDKYATAIGDFAAVFAPNYVCPRVPIPILEPWNAYGAVRSGLATYSRYQPKENIRFQLPGHYPMPDRMFQLDRCLLMQRYPTQNGKDLVLINIHNSAYDPDNAIKKLQLPYLRDIATKEYEKGNYVILGGDWNQCPPKIPSNLFRKNEMATNWESSLPADFFPPDWQPVFDSLVPTCRKLKDPYIKDETMVVLIDWFYVSPNVEVKKIQGKDMNFAFSDHQPVEMWVNLVND